MSSWHRLRLLFFYFIQFFSLYVFLLLQAQHIPGNLGDLVLYSLEFKIFFEKLERRRYCLNAALALKTVKAKNSQLKLTLYIGARYKAIGLFVYFDPIKFDGKYVLTAILHR